MTHEDALTINLVRDIALKSNGTEAEILCRLANRFEQLAKLADGIDAIVREVDDSVMVRNAMKRFHAALGDEKPDRHTITVCDACFHGKHNECADLTSNIYDCDCNCPRAVTPVMCSASGETIIALKKLDHRIGDLERMPHNQWRPDRQAAPHPNAFCAHVGCQIIGPHEHKVEGPAEAVSDTLHAICEKVPKS